MRDNVKSIVDYAQDLTIDQGGGFKHELALREEGYQWIAGVDEAGRGPLAGPVVAAAFIVKIPNNAFKKLEGIIFGVNDSKKLTEHQREELYRQLVSSPELFAYGIGVQSPEVIDRVNILQATKLAMQEALYALPIKPDFLLVDGLKLDFEGLPCEKIIKGDQRCYSIAAASILAKVHRDRLMGKLDEDFPLYGFAKHKGYGTPMHLKMIEQNGPIPDVHRFTFAPMKGSQINLK